MTLLRTRTMVSGNFKKQLNLESYHKKNVKGIRVQNASNAQICGLQRAGVPTAMLVDKFCMAALSHGCKPRIWVPFQLRTNLRQAKPENRIFNEGMGREISLRLYCYTCFKP